MAKKVLSIEIGQQVTKAVVIDFLKKNPHVYNAFSFDTAGRCYGRRLCQG